MNCQQIRESFEKLIDGEKPGLYAIEIEEHLASCPECREWYTQELLAINALEMLEPFPASPDFTECVMLRLPDTLPQQESQPSASSESPLLQIRRAWDSLVEGVARPSARRRWAPVLAAAASLILVVGLWYGLQGNDVSTTAGTAVGTMPWLIGGAVVLVIGLAIAVLILWRRRG